MRINPNTPLNAQEAFDKATRYCCAEERCRSQVVEKLRQWNVPQEMTNGLLIGLENSGFLNEDRYAEIFVRSKVRQNNWGRYQIIHALKAANVNPDSIRHGIESLDEQTYLDALQNVIRKAQKLIHEEDTSVKRMKIVHHAVSKGFESDLVIQTLKNIDEQEIN